MIRQLGLSLAFAALFSLSGQADAYESKPPFEPALRVQTVSLGKDRSNPGTEMKLTCYTYHQVMVKERSEGGPGATVTFVPIGADEKPPACGKTKLANERNFPGGGLGGSGSFVGLAAGMIVLGGYPASGLDAREIYDPATRKRRFQDHIKFGTELGDVALEGGTLRLRYTRGIAGDCSVITDGPACAQSMARKAAVPELPFAECRARYADAVRTETARLCGDRRGDQAACAALTRKQTNDSHTIIAYDAEAAITPGSPPVFRPLGQTVLCWSSD